MRLLIHLFAVALLLNHVECGILRFLRYDLECHYLTREEYNRRMIVGRCPPTTVSNLTTTTLHPDVESRLHKAKERVSARAKKALLKFILLGKKHEYVAQLSDTSVTQLELTEGIFLRLKCPGGSGKVTSAVTWYRDGEKLSHSLLDWRVQVDEQGSLRIMPLFTNEDNAHYDCFRGVQPIGSLRLRVLSTGDALLQGWIRYLLGAAFCLPLVLFAVVLRLLRPESQRVTYGGDEKGLVTEFREKMLMTKDEEVHGSIRNQVSSRRSIVKSVMAPAEEDVPDEEPETSSRSNRDTVMTILRMGELHNSRATDLYRQTADNNDPPEENAPANNNSPVVNV